MSTSSGMIIDVVRDDTTSEGLRDVVRDDDLHFRVVVLDHNLQDIFDGFCAKFGTFPKLEIVRFEF